MGGSGQGDERPDARGKERAGGHPEERALAVAHVEDGLLPRRLADGVERGGEVLPEVRVERPARARAPPRAAVAAQIEGEAVEPGAREVRRDRVALDAEVERLPVHGDAVDEQHRRPARRRAREPMAEDERPAVPRRGAQELVLPARREQLPAPEQVVGDGEEGERGERREDAGGGHRRILRSRRRPRTARAPNRIPAVARPLQPWIDGSDERVPERQLSFRLARNSRRKPGQRRARRGRIAGRWSTGSEHEWLTAPSDGV